MSESEVERKEAMEWAQKHRSDGERCVDERMKKKIPPLRSDGII